MFLRKIFPPALCQKNFVLVLVTWINKYVLHMAAVGAKMTVNVTHNGQEVTAVSLHVLELDRTLQLYVIAGECAQHQIIVNHAWEDMLVQTVRFQYVMEFWVMTRWCAMDEVGACPLIHVLCARGLGMDRTVSYQSVLEFV
jgi:hypothetical protein